MEEERVLSRHVALAEEVVEQVEAPAQRLAEAGLLPGGHLAEEVVLAGQVGIGGPHDLDRRVDQRPGDLTLEAQQAGVAHRPADLAAQHVAAPLVGGHHAVGQ
jgi:hypothetical protein